MHNVLLLLLALAVLVCLLVMFRIKGDDTTPQAPPRPTNEVPPTQEMKALRRQLPPVPPQRREKRNN